MRVLSPVVMALGVLIGYAQDPVEEECCKAKTNNGLIYYLVEGEEIATFKNCTSACVYERFDIPGSRFCFAQGGAESSCLKIPLTQVQGDCNNDQSSRNGEFFTIGGLTEKDFNRLTTSKKITYFKGLNQLNLKSLVLDKFCGGIQNCFYLIRRGATDAQRLSLLSENPEYRDLYYGETCDEECKYLQEEFSAKRNFTITELLKSYNPNNVLGSEEYEGSGYDEYGGYPYPRQGQRQVQDNNQQFEVEEVKKDQTFLGGTKQNYIEAGTALNGMNQFQIALKNADGDGLKVLAAFIDLGETIFPLTGPIGAAVAMFAGPLKLLFGLGVTPNGFLKLEKMLKDLTAKVEEEHDRTRRNLEIKIDVQTAQLQTGFKSLDNSFTDNTKLIERRIIAQTKLLIEKIQEPDPDLKAIINDAIVSFTSSNREQTTQILSEVQLQNREHLRTLSKLYSRADQDVQSFFDAFDELNGMRNKLVLMDVFLNINVDDNVYEDLSTIMNQFSTFEGAKTFGATRSWMSRFCRIQENTHLCIDLLALYISLATLRDQVFFRLGSTIKKSDHGDADILAKQIFGTTHYRQKVDGDFLVQMLGVQSSSGGCILACMTQALDEKYTVGNNENIVENKDADDLTFKFPGTILEDPKTFAKDMGRLVCKYMKSNGGHTCNYDAATCSKCFEDIECKEGFYKKYTSNRYTCLPCECELVGTIQLSDEPKQACNSNGTCFCNSFYEGEKCDRCKDPNAADCFKGTCPDNFYTDPETGKCVDCDCETDADNTVSGTFCNKNTGQCECRDGYTDRRCDKCADGFTPVGAKGCQECICSQPLAEPGNKCDSYNYCKCKPNVMQNCKRCFDGYYVTNDNECVNCNCNEHGAESQGGTGFNQYWECEDITGRCTCKLEYQTEDKKCSSCNKALAYFNPSDSRCYFCQCHAPGSVDSSCVLKNGLVTCKCKEDYIETAGSGRCHFKKGIDSFNLKFGNDPGGMGIKFKICTDEINPDCCVTDQLNLAQKEGWHSFKDNLGNCKSKPFIACGKRLKVEKIEVGVGITGFVNDVTIDAIEIEVGIAKFSLDEEGVWEWGEEQVWNKDLLCKKDCPPYCSKKSNRNSVSSNSQVLSEWSFPPPHLVSRP